MGVIRRINLGGLLLLSLAAIGVRSAGAQEMSVYGGGGVMLSTQRPGTTGQGSSIPPTGVGGTAVGVSGEFGTFLNPALSLAFEVSLPARFTSEQFTGIPNSRIESRHHDLIFSGLFHVHAPSSGHVRFALVAGPSVIREDTLFRHAFAPFGSTAFGPLGPETSFARWTVGATFGADLTVQAGRHVQIVPQIRLHWIDRAKLGGNTNGVAGLSPLVTRPAVGVRVGF